MASHAAAWLTIILGHKVPGVAHAPDGRNGLAALQHGAHYSCNSTTRYSHPEWWGHKVPGVAHAPDGRNGLAALQHGAHY